jgi:hypothetical protein
MRGSSSGLALAAGVAVAVAVTLGLAGCGSGSGRAPTTAATTPATHPPTTKPRPPTTTVFKPAAPQVSPDASAAQLVQAWAAGNRPLASSVATPAAVATLFAVPYPGEPEAIPRGCSSAFPPIVCSYGPPGGASPTDPLFEIFVSQTATAGWYVSSVTVDR